MDREIVKDLSRKEKEKFDIKESIEELSSLNKMSFSKEKTQGDKCNKQATQPKIQSTC